MDGQVRGQVVLVGLGEGGPAHDAGVVDQDVETAELPHRGVHQRLRARGAGDVVRVGHGRATAGDDGRNDLVGRVRVAAGSFDGAAQVVDHHAGAALGQQQGVGPPDASPRTGDDGDAPVETELAQAATGALYPSSPPRVPPSMASRSSAGTPTNSSSMICRLPRNVPSACG